MTLNRISVLVAAVMTTVVIIGSVAFAGISDQFTSAVASTKSSPTSNLVATVTPAVTTTTSPTIVLFHNGTVTIFAAATGSITRGTTGVIIPPPGGGQDVYYTWSEQVCEWANDFWGITLWKMCLSATWTADQTMGTIPYFEQPGEDNYEGALGYSMSVDQNTASQVGPGQVNYFAENAIIYLGVNTGSNPDCWIHGFVYNNPMWGCS